MFRRRTEAPRRPARPDWRSYDSVAEAYDRVRTPVHEGPARALVEAVGPPQGGKLLDVGTGPGIAALIAEEAVGPDGLVVGSDVSLPMLEFARRNGLTRAVAATAIDLPFGDATFDAVTASFVIFFFTRYETALFDMTRVLRPGGRLGVTTWGQNEDEFRRAWRELAESYGGRRMLDDALRRVAPWEARFSRPEPLMEALQGAGLRAITVDRATFRVTQSQEDYLVGRETSAVGRFLQGMLGESLWERFRSQARETFGARFPDPIGDTSEVLIAVGSKE
jgi:ubiquinone/menaquinone biosynthesis C-methylase UbiE